MGSAFAAIVLVGVTILATTVISGKFIVVPSNGNVVILPSSSMVLLKIQKMDRLETVSYNIQRVYKYDQNANSPWYDVWKAFGDQRKLFVVPGKVIAGVDLTQISKGDVQVRAKTITITLPPSQIFDTNVDEQNIQVYDMSTGLATLSQGMDPNVYNQILAAAKVSLKNDACNQGILRQAADNARQQFTSFLTELGYTNVTVNAPAGTC